ncbi:hypothetical protein Tco_0948118 [Tanacetum coccineum]
MILVDLVLGGKTLEQMGKIFQFVIAVDGFLDGKIFTSSTTKVDIEPTNCSNEDITNPYECKQTLNVSACTSSVNKSSSPIEESKQDRPHHSIELINYNLMPTPTNATDHSRDCISIFLSAPAKGTNDDVAASFLSVQFITTCSMLKLQRTYLKASKTQESKKLKNQIIAATLDTVATIVITEEGYCCHKLQSEASLMLEYVLTRKRADNNRLTWIQASAARRLEGVKEGSSRSML